MLAAISIPPTSKRFRTAVTPMFVFIFFFAWLGVFGWVLIKEGLHVNVRALMLVSAFLVVYSLAASWMMSLA